jgi:hypothetical protein
VLGTARHSAPPKLPWHHYPDVPKPDGELPSPSMHVVLITSMHMPRLGVGEEARRSRRRTTSLLPPQTPCADARTHVRVAPPGWHGHARAAPRRNAPATGHGCTLPFMRFAENPATASTTTCTRPTTTDRKAKARAHLGPDLRVFRSELAVTCTVGFNLTPIFF